MKKHCGNWRRDKILINLRLAASSEKSNISSWLGLKGDTTEKGIVIYREGVVLWGKISCYGNAVVVYVRREKVFRNVLPEIDVTGWEKECF